MENLLSVLKQSEILKLKLRFLYEKYGYKKYEMSRFEEYAFYLENRNFLINESVITFTDLDGRLLALKPDVTLSIAKHYLGEEQKVYYTENVYRPDRTKRSFKEIEQMGLERVGGIDSATVNEVVTLAAKTINIVSDNGMLEVSHCAFLRGLLNAITDNVSLKKELSILISEKNKNAVEALANKHGISDFYLDALIKVIDANGDYDTVVNAVKDITVTEDMKIALAELRELNEALGAEDSVCDIRYDLSLNGEDDYYNGIVFCGYVKGLPFRVLSGGRYDALLAKLGKSGGALGFALYLDELQFIYDENLSREV